MQELRVTIQLGNDAMQTREEIAAALHKAADEFLHHGKMYQPIMDANGNKVGKLEIVKNQDA